MDIREEVAIEVRAFLETLPPSMSLSTTEMQSRILKRPLTEIEIRQVFNALAYHAKYTLREYATKSDPIEKVIRGKLQTIRPLRWHAPRPVECCPTCGKPR